LHVDTVYQIEYVVATLIHGPRIVASSRVRVLWERGSLNVPVHAVGLIALTYYNYVVFSIQLLQRLAQRKYEHIPDMVRLPRLERHWV
jgi:hypothetical protein